MFHQFSETSSILHLNRQRLLLIQATAALIWLSKLLLTSKTESAWNVYSICFNKTYFWPDLSNSITLFYKRYCFVSTKPDLRQTWHLRSLETSDTDSETATGRTPKLYSNCLLSNLVRRRKPRQIIKRKSHCFDMFLYFLHVFAFCIPGGGLPPPDLPKNRPDDRMLQTSWQATLIKGQIRAVRVGSYPDQLLHVCSTTIFWSFRDDPKIVATVSPNCPKSVPAVF